MQEWTDSIKIAIDTMVACVIVVALIVCNSTSKLIMRTMDEERAATADVQEYRVAHMYENADCYAQDIVSLVLEYQGSPAVNVTFKTGRSYIWSSSTYATAMSSSAISAVLKQNCIYRCTLSYDANGSLASYNFREV